MAGNRSFYRRMDSKTACIKIINNLRIFFLTHRNIGIVKLKKGVSLA
jgi:hypothetical protein